MHHILHRARAMCLLVLVGAISGADLLPDLVIDGPAVGRDIRVDRNRIPGATLLRMPTVVANIGQGAVEIRGGAVNGDGTQDVHQRIYQSDGGHRDRLAGTFVHHPTHGHVHFEDFAQFRLRIHRPDGSIGPVLREGAKVGFCLIDWQYHDTSLPGFSPQYTYAGCGSERQGLSVGWADVYGSSLDDQWIDITGVPPGIYWIEVMTDPADHLTELDEGNNSAFIPYSIGALDNSVTGTIFDDRDSDGVRDAGEPGLVGWRAFLDLDGSGLRENGVTIVRATDVPAEIRDLSKATHELEVSGIVGAITDIDVRIDLTHTWDNDLAVALISPSGRRITLIDNVGGSGDNFIATLLDDEAATPISGGVAPFSGAFRPLVRLSAFDGQSPNGHWKLEITDQVRRDAGRLLAWSLVISHSEPVATTDGLGIYRIGSWSDGPVRVDAENPGGGWIGPNPSSHRITLAGAPVDFRDFAFWREGVVTGAVFNDLNGNGFRNPGDNGLFGWQVYDDLNGNGIYDRGAVNRFSRDVPKPILDRSTTRSFLVVTDLPGVIEDLDVRVNLLHVYVGDLTLTLIAPSGQRVPLFNRHGDFNDNIVTTFNDEAASDITAGTPPYFGSFRPFHPLFDLDGGSPNGVWRLEIVDALAGGEGTLRSWSMRVAHGERTTTSGISGRYTLGRLRPGTHRIRQVPMGGWIQTTPPGGVHLFTFPPGGGSRVGLFGNQLFPAIPWGNG
jgi:subtilisin-like proprotein convertase family protein